jgi:DNA polymerase III alpha subunit (gram-positive type)
MAGFKPTHILVMDWETSGAEFGMSAEEIAKKYQGISLGLIVADFETLEEVYSDYFLIKYDTQYTWTQKAEEIHGITREELEKNGVSREEAMERVLGAILEFWGPKGIIVFGAHNAAFDMAFLQEQILKPAGVTLEFHQAKLDTAVLGMMLFGNGRSDFVFELLAGCDGRGAHNSLDDARFCLKSMRTAKQLFQEIFNE